LTNVLGFRLSEAIETLLLEDVQVETQEVRSRKGVPDGDARRVIQQIPIDRNHVRLLFAVFKTEPNEAIA
jgi:hypothetical protein